MRLQVAARGGSMEQFLEQSGLAEKEFRDRLAFELGMKRLLMPQLTTATLEATFARHRRELDGSLVRASHIVLRPPSTAGDASIADVIARAARIRSEILRGSLTFADAAKKYSAGPSRHRGGDIGLFPRNSVMNDAFAKQAFTLARGEISQPFLTPFGVHLLTVTAVEPGRNDFTSVRPVVERLASQEVLRKIVAEARRRIPIEYEAGVPHLDPPAPVDTAGERRVVWGPDRPQTAPPAEK
jgi:hypothetical protein